MMVSCVLPVNLKHELRKFVVVGGFFSAAECLKQTVLPIFVSQMPVCAITTFNLVHQTTKDIGHHNKSFIIRLCEVFWTLSFFKYKNFSKHSDIGPVRSQYSCLKKRNNAVKKTCCGNQHHAAVFRGLRPAVNFQIWSRGGCVLKLQASIIFRLIRRFDTNPHTNRHYK